MFETHEFLSTINLECDEEHAALVLKAVSEAINSTMQTLVRKDILTDPRLTLIDLQADMNQELSDLSTEMAGIKNLRFIVELNLVMNP